MLAEKNLENIGTYFMHNLHLGLLAFLVAICWGVCNLDMETPGVPNGKEVWYIYRLYNIWLMFMVNVRRYIYHTWILWI